MHKLSAAALAVLVGVGGSAFADGFAKKSKYAAPVADAPVIVPVTSWTGFYVGLGVGGDFVNHDLKADAGYNPVYTAKKEGYQTEFYGPIKAELDGFGGNGVFGTVQVGYDYQAQSRFVIGVFFDYDFASSAESKVSLSAGDGSYTVSLSDKWTVGGRLGYLVNPNTLVYALGGYTQADFDFPHLDVDTFSGFTVGGGIETSLGGNWFLKGEYRYTELDTETLFSSEGSLAKSSYYDLKVTDEPTIQSARLVLSYKFNGAAPAYAPLK